MNNTINNLSNARGRIQDADYAVEVSNMTKANILQQAGTSVLSQANQVPQTVLSLLCCVNRKQYGMNFNPAMRRVKYINRLYFSVILSLFLTASP